MNEMFRNPNQEYTMPAEKPYGGEQLNDAVGVFESTGHDWACYAMFGVAALIIGAVIFTPIYYYFN